MHFCNIVTNAQRGTILHFTRKRGLIPTCALYGRPRQLCHYYTFLHSLESILKSKLFHIAPKWVNK